MRNKSVHRLVDEALGEDPRLALAAAHALEAEVEWMLRNAVTRARLRGYDWGRIARLLGRSRQGVRQRFGAVAPLRQSPTVLREAASTAEFDRIDQLKADVHRNYLWSTETDMVPW